MLKQFKLNEMILCDICNGEYPKHKHDFKDCKPVDIEWDKLKSNTDFSLLYEPGILDWFYGNNITNCHELTWGMNIERKYNIRTNREKKTNQWTTFLCEEVVYLLLILNGFKPIRRPVIETQESCVSSYAKKCAHIPDLGTDDFYFEVKGRNYSTSGTAGEKITGVPFKYSDIPNMTNKRVIIVCCGYQEIEARDTFKLFGGGDDGKVSHLNYFNEKGFTYVACSDLLKTIIS